MFVLLLFAAPAYADTPSGCPAAVTTGIMKAFPRATIGTCKAEHEHGKDIFEVKLTKANGDKVEVDIAPDGTVLQIEENVAIDALPDAVKKAFAAKYPKAKATGAEKQTAGNQVHYEIAFQTDKGRKEATFSSDGSFLEEE
jgi:Putative beta-lactamase-inhibitor-like, PepSY-like